MVQIEHGRTELHVSLRAVLAHRGLGPAVEFPAGEQAPLVGIAQRQPAALLAVGAGIDFDAGSAGVEQALQGLKVFRLGNDAPLVDPEGRVTLAQIVECPRHHVDPGDVGGGLGQVLVLEAVAQHRMVVEQLEYHGDLCAAFDVLQHDELADAAGIDALGVLAHQEELRLCVEEIAIGLQADRGGGTVRRGGPLIAGLEVGNLLSEKVTIRGQLKRRANPTVGECPGILVRVEIRLRSAECQA